MARPTIVFSILVLGAMLPGCGNPVSDAVKIGLHVVGKVVDDAEVDQLGSELMGQPPSKADDVLGEEIDVYADADDRREWRVYPAPADVLNNHRLVVETTPDRIVMVEKVALDSEKLDIPLQLVWQEKLKGKSPSECQAELKMGTPLLNLRSRKSGQQFQIYDARLIKELPKPHYLITRFDVNGQCDKVKLAEVSASDHAS